MSESEETAEDAAAEAEPRMRRRLLGYKRADVEQALETRDHAVSGLEGELDTREAELVELRQDVAALWLAFAQHDRMIKSLSDAMTAALEASARLAGPAREDRPAPTPEPAAAERESAAPDLETTTPEPKAPLAEPQDAPDSDAGLQAAAADASVGHQLAELDEVLAAIEMATKTLEQTYEKEIEQLGVPEQPAEPEQSEGPDEPDDDPQEMDDSEEESGGN